MATLSIRRDTPDTAHVLTASGLLCSGVSHPNIPPSRTAQVCWDCWGAIRWARVRGGRVQHAFVGESLSMCGKADVRDIASDEEAASSCKACLRALKP